MNTGVLMAKFTKEWTQFTKERDKLSDILAHSYGTVCAAPLEQGVNNVAHTVPEDRIKTNL
jgi:hypothetical protein